MNTERFNAQRVQDRCIDEFIGMCQGVIADNEINEAEKNMLIKKIRECKLELHTLINPLYSYLISNNSLDDIKTEIENFLGLNFESYQVMQIPLDDIDEINLENKHFVLTGTFCNAKKNDRSFIKNLLSELGAINDKNVTMKTNYLVIGECGKTKDWLHSNSGRKIEYALKLKKDGNTDLHIISESQLIRFVEKIYNKSLDDE